MNTLKWTSRILMILISFFFSCKEKNISNEKTYTFNSIYLNTKTYPIYPKAEVDTSYSKVGVYVFSYIYGWDPKNRMIYSYYTEDSIERVKKFYEEIYSIKFLCEIENHNDFMKKYWDLFQEYEFPDAEGYFEYCKGQNIDLISPVYHYGKLRWESGTMIVFIPEKYL